MKLCIEQPRKGNTLVTTRCHKELLFSHGLVTVIQTLEIPFGGTSRSLDYKSLETTWKNSEVWVQARTFDLSCIDASLRLSNCIIQKQEEVSFEAWANYL